VTRDRMAAHGASVAHRARSRTECGRPLAAVVVLMMALMVPGTAAAQNTEMPPPIHDDRIFWMVLIDQFEYAWSSDHNPVSWDLKAWVGEDFNRIWLKSEGGRATNRKGGEFEVQAVYGRLISPFWEVQAGVRIDRQLASVDPETRTHFAFGFEGLAPYWLEVEPVLFISAEGEVSARFEASHDILLSQRLVLRPEVEFNFAAQSVPSWGIGSGLVDGAVALRFRYEIWRQFAPYVGVEWAQRFGETADLAREAGEKTVEWSVLGGFRIWF
jgi:copper resistance protein B